MPGTQGKSQAAAFYFPAKGAEMRQALRKVRLCDTQETVTAEQLFVI